MICQYQYQFYVRLGTIDKPRPRHRNLYTQGSAKFSRFWKEFCEIPRTRARNFKMWREHGGSDSLEKAKRSFLGFPLLTRKKSNLSSHPDDSTQRKSSQLCVEISHAHSQEAGEQCFQARIC